MEQLSISVCHRTRLEELFNQGVITDEEYRRERYKVLHSL
jgi:hypothetical protein